MPKPSDTSTGTAATVTPEAPPRTLANSKGSGSDLPTRGPPRGRCIGGGRGPLLGTPRPPRLVSVAAAFKTDGKTQVSAPRCSEPFRQIVTWRKRWWGPGLQPNSTAGSGAHTRHGRCRGQVCGRVGSDCAGLSEPGSPLGVSAEEGPRASSPGITGPPLGRTAVGLLWVTAPTSQEGLQADSLATRPVVATAPRRPPGRSGTSPPARRACERGPSVCGGHGRTCLGLPTSLGQRGMNPERCPLRRHTEPCVTHRDSPTLTARGAEPGPGGRSPVGTTVASASRAAAPRPSSQTRTHPAGPAGLAHPRTHHALPGLRAGQCCTHGGQSRTHRPSPEDGPASPRAGPVAA